ncbi:hypothetical protein ccbrp13_33460 [Ktedonobacteria bacterium brp13]|nr:hypothetical protein ccbrp13_33460 [Ktedonobacteria bacterium brp13]
MATQSNLSGNLTVVGIYVAYDANGSVPYTLKGGPYYAVLSQYQREADALRLKHLSY